MIKINFVKPAADIPSADALIVGIYSDNKLSKAAAALDKAFIQSALKRQANFTGKAGQILSLTPPDKSKYDRYILLGMGTRKELSLIECETMGGNLAAALKDGVTQKAVILLDDDAATRKLPEGAQAAHMALGAQLRVYNFDKYKNSPKGSKTASLKSLTFVTPQNTASSKLFKHCDAVSQGTYLARDLMNEPPNVLYPQSFAQRIVSELKPLGVSVEILDEKKMQTLGMGAALAVGQGSIRPPRMVVMRWMGAGKTKASPAPIAFVGKGVTFDTGGISIKPAASMDEMKMDMGGAAAVTGLMKALATRKAKVNVVAIVGLAENMPSDRAYRPGDIITSMAGKTIEVLNTDAEGRLVLCDAMTYIQRTYKPQLMIELSTLTGAIMIALGTEYAGAFANDDNLWAQLQDASSLTGEKMWRMPLDDCYRRAMDGKITDLNNMGDASRYGGACNAAAFLEAFVEDERPWCHLDIAGMMINRADKPTIPRGPAGYGVRILDRFVADHYEQ
jgi:leucyl aminopeptidase